MTEYSKLPPLPDPMPDYPESGEATYTADQMHAYAMSAIASLSRRRRQPAPAMELRHVIDALVDKYGTFRAVSKATGVDVAYLSRLRNGEKNNPSTETLKALGLERVILYRMSTDPKEHDHI